MAGRPALVPGVRWRELEGGGVFLEWPGGSAVLAHPVYAQVLPRLSGAASSQEVVGGLPESIAPAEAFFALDRLRSMGVVGDALEEGGVPDPDPAPATGGASEGARSPVVRARVHEVGLDAVDRRTLYDLLSRGGIERTEGASVVLVVAADLLDPELAEWNRRALDEEAVWMGLVALGGEAWLGPVHRSGAPCLECLGDLVRRHTVGRGAGAGPLRLLGPRVGATLARALSEARERLLRTGPANPEDRALIRFLPDGSHTRHPVVRRPQCPGCGRGSRRGGREGIESETDGGGAAPVAVRDRIAALVDPVTGVVRRLTPLSRGAGMPWWVHRAVGPYPPGPASPAPVVGLGCGFDPDASRLRAVAEVVERYSGTFQGDEPRVRASFEDLGPEAVHPNACMLFSERQYRMRDVWNAHPTPFAAVPERFDVRTAIDWTPVRRLGRPGTRLLPTSYLYFAAPADTGTVGILADSNGCAAGATTDEAALRGLLELIERDAVAAWWYGQAPAPRLPTPWGPSDAEAAAAAYLATTGRTTWALDLTTDLGVPVAAVLSGEGPDGGERVLFGFGAGLSPDAAREAALREMLQMVAVVEAGLAEGRAPAPDLRRWLRRETVARNPWLRGKEATRSSTPPAGPEAPRGGLDRCVAALASRGVEAFLLDQTRPDVAIPVVRVLAPGLRHFWPRFAPGRLYDVPVAAGWLSRPRAEAELNPTPLFV